MKLIHKVEECAVYESNKHSYVSHASTSLSSSSSSLSQVKTFLLKITSSNANAALALLSSIERSAKRAHAYAYKTSIKFKALKMTPLKTFIDNMHSLSPSLSKGMAYTLTLKLLADIGTQLEQLRSERGLIIPFLSFEDIVVIETRNQNHNDNQNQDDQEEETDDDPKTEYTFVFMNAEKLVKKSNKNKLIIDVPLKVNKHTSFLPTELPESALKRLPMRFTTTSWCYSLSALCIYALLQHKFKNGEDDIERVGRPFLHTSLYFCLKRCLKPDPEERVLLYV
jgi:hypothetical protein